MGAALRIAALLGNAQPLHWPAAYKVLGNNFFGIFGLHVAVPDRVGVNHHRGAVLALVKAAGLIDSHLRAQSSLPRQLLQPRMQIAFSILRATGPRRIGGSDIMTDKNVAFECGQAANLLGIDNLRVKPPSAGTKFPPKSCRRLAPLPSQRLGFPGNPAKKDFLIPTPPPSAKIGA
jgi:hypothetical protein